MEEVEPITREESGRDNPKSLFWPEELLLTVIPKTRIYTWGYDVDINHIFSSAGQSTVFQHATTLLSDLVDQRTSTQLLM
jgi:PBP1b-binding outer membrane lipoprotein LpoB